MDSPHQVRVPIIANQRPALLEVVARIIHALSTALLHDRARIFHVAVYTLDRCIDTIFLVRVSISER